MKIAPALADRSPNKPATPVVPQAPSGRDFARRLHSLTPAEMIPGVRSPAKPLNEFAPAPAPRLMPLGDGPFNPARPREPKTQHEKVQETARKWVAQTFYGPMLKQMREGPFKSELFSGGRGGQAFSTMLDQRLAEHMARGADSKLVRAIARQMEAKSTYQKQAPTPPKPAAGSANPYQNVRTHVAPGLRA